MTNVFIMTAAHCIVMYPIVYVDTVIVRVGSIHRLQGGQEISVSELRVHGGK